MEETIETRQGGQNPFLNIWIRPRGTIRQIVDNDPDKYVIILATISGVYQSLDRAAKRSFGDDMSLVAIILISLFIGALGGILSLYIGGALFRWSGSLFGGTADSTHVRAALAWSSVPDIVLLVIFIPIIAVFGHDWFTSSTAWMDANESLALVVVGLLAFVGLILVVWKAFLFTKCLAEVHSFSAWRGLVSIVVGFLIVIVPIFVLIFGCGMLT